MNSLLDSPVQQTMPNQSASPTKINVQRLRQLHRFAGLTLAVFIGLHLTNHLFALVSIEQHIKIMDALRLIYRNPLGEALLLLAIMVQVPSGILLVRRKGWRGLQLAERAQVASGGYLAFFLVAHVFAVMMGRYFFHVDTNFYFASAVLFSPVWLFYVVYYGLSVVSVFTHVASIHYQKMLPRTSPRHAQTQALVIVGAGIIVMMMILLVFSGAVYEIRIPTAYKWW